MEGSRFEILYVITFMAMIVARLYFEMVMDATAALIFAAPLQSINSEQTCKVHGLVAMEATREYA